MAGKSTISITFKLDGDSKEFKELTTDAAGLKKVLQSAIAPAENLKKSLINWSQGVQAIDAITNTISTVSSALSQFSDRMKGLQSANIAITQLTGKTGDEMLKLRSKVQAVSEHFGTDFNETLRAANALSKGFGISMEDAMKLVQDGLVSGANAGGDFIDTVREYPRYFKEAGLSAEDFIVITTKAAQQGVFSDKGVDVIKEGNLRIREMTTATADALNGIGISAEKVQADLQAGSITTFDVMQMVAAKLNELPASSAAVGTAIADIFGGPGEDAGLEYIKTLANIQLNMDAVKAATQGTAEQQERQIQMQENLKNGLSGIIDLSAIYTDVKPYVDLTAQIGMTAVGVGSLIKTMKAMNVQHLIMIARTKAGSAAMVLFGLKTTQAAAFTRVFSAALKTGAYSATAFKIALKGLLITTGIGAIFAAVTTIIEHFSAKTDEATDKVDELKEAEETFTSTAANTKVELDNEIKSLSRLIIAKQDTTAAVQHLNEKYGDAFGTYKTAADWYDVLTKKSSVYAKQIGYEAQARTLATKIAEKELALEMNAEKQKQLQASGQDKSKKIGLTTYTDAAGNKNLGFEWKTVDSNAMEEAKTEARGLRTDLAGLEKQLELVQGKLDSCAKEMQTVTAEVSTQTQTVKVSEMTWQQVSDAISETEKKLKNTTDKQQILQLKSYNAQLKARKQLLEASTGLGSTGGKTTPDKPVWDSNASTLKDITGNIEILREKLQKASIEEAALINQQIDAWNEKAEAIKKAGRAAEDNTPLWKEDADTLKEITDNLQILNAKLENSTAEEAALINQQIAAWSEKAEAIKNAGKSVDNGPVWKEDASTLQDIGNNIEMLSSQLQTATIDEAALINQQIAAWNEKADAIRNAGKEAEKSAGSTGKALMQGWSGIKGIGSSIEGITNALQGNGNAWQTVVGIVDGFLGLYQGFQTVIQIIGALTGVTNMLTAAKQSEAIATATATTTAVTGAAQEMAASAGLAATKNVETTANVAAAASGAMSAHAGIPFVGIALGLAAVAAIIAAMASLPKFAKGGIVSGPTLAMVGEYAGASGNPEVIAPLDKLRGMLAPTAAAVDFSKVRFEIKGRTLVGILEKESDLKKRN